MADLRERFAGFGGEIAVHAAYVEKRTPRRGLPADQGPLRLHRSRRRQTSPSRVPLDRGTVGRGERSAGLYRVIASSARRGDLNVK